jgi:hypothetical protein
MWQHQASALRRRWGAFLLGVAFLAAPARASVVTFNSLSHGQIVTNQFAASHGLTISANNINRPHDLAIIFDSLQTNTADPDLEGPPWSGGNLPSNTVLNDMLILAENDVDVIAPFGFIDDPDDEGSRPAGDLIFSFASPITAFGFDIVDVEGVMDENGFISFFLGGVPQGVVNFSQFVTPGMFFDPTVDFEDHSANRIKTITAAQLGSSGFDRVVVRMGGSGALDNLVIPEPTGLALLAGTASLLSRRSRRGYSSRSR